MLKLRFSKYILAGFHFSSSKLPGLNVCSWRDAPAGIQRDKTGADREPEGQTQSLLNRSGIVSAEATRLQSLVLGKGTSGNAVAAMPRCGRKGVTLQLSAVRLLPRLRCHCQSQHAFLPFTTKTFGPSTPR